MTPWQVLRASRATQAALGYRVHHGPGGLVHYSTAPAVTAAAVAPDSSRSFCLSREKLSLQQLNRRLASYLQQVQCLEAANQRLERQIQEELDRKCPRELRELDGHLRTVSLLQDQIGECLSAQAQVKLQLLGAELTVLDLNGRCEKERERRGCMEAELSDLRLLEEELQVHRLQSLLNNQTQQLMELQIKHQQDMQGLQAQVSGGVAVEMQTAESSDLIQQLDDLRQTSVTLLDKNQNECWFNTQVSLLSSPEVTFDPPAGSEVVQAELQELRRTAASLEEELKQLQALNVVLEASGLDQTESFVLQLVVLQQRAHGLCRDLDSVLQAAAQQAADHQALLDVKTRLETEIQDYRMLLDGLRPQGVSSLHSNSAANFTSFCATTGPSAFRRNVMVDKTIKVQGGNLRMMEVQTVSRGHIRTVGQTPIVAPLSETVATVQSIRVHSKHPKNSPVTSINTSKLTGSFDKSENQRTGAFPERGRESMTISAMINRQSSSVEDKVHAEDHDLQNSSIVSTQISQGLDERAVVKASKLEINTAQEITTSVPDTQSARSAAVQAKPEMFTSKQISTEAGLQANKTGTNIQTEITKTILCAEPEVKQGPHMTTTDPIKQTAAEVKKETETVISAQMNCTEGSIQAKNQDPTKVVSLSLETPTEAVGDAREVAVTASVVSGSHSLRSEEAQGKVSGELTLMDDKDIERQEKKGEEEVVEVGGTSLVFRSDQSSALADASNSEQNKVMEDADTGSAIATASSGSPDNNDNLESITESTEILKKVELEVNKGKVVNGFHDTNEVKVDPTESDNEMVNLAGQEALLSTTESKKSTSLTDSGVGLCSSSPEELLSPREAHVFMSPTKPSAYLSPELCLSPVETEVLMRMTDQVFRPVNPEEHVRSPDSLLSPNDPEMFLSPNDSDTCLSPVEAKVCLSPNGEEEDEEACLSLTEANAHVRPVEKYILSTKEEGQSLSFSGDQALPEEDRNRKVSISVRDGESLCFGSFEGNEGSRGTLNGTNINSRPTSREIGLQLSSSLGGSEFGGPGGRSIIADKEEQLGFGGLYRKSVRDARSPRDRYKDTGGIADNKDLAASFGGTAANSSGTVSGNAEAATTAGVQGRFRHGSGEWMVYGGSLGHTSTSLPSTGSEESPSGATLPATSRPETGRFSSRGSGEWMVYGSSLGRKSSLDGGTSLPSEGKEEGLSVATNPVTSSQETGRFGRRGSGEWMVYGGSLGRKSSLPSTRSEESPPTATHLATSQPETKKFGSRGSGEWRVYGGSTGRMSRVAGSNSLPNADSEESPSVAMQLATSPPGTLREGRFGSVGSGEWRVYGGSTGRLSSASSTDRVSVSANYSQITSPPSSHTSSGPRLSSAGSGGRLSSGSVVRRSSSVGSGGRLSSSGSGSRLSNSSGSHRTSSSGRFASTGSGEWKPVYSSASGRKSSVGSAGRSGGGGMTSSQRAPSPGGRMGASMGSGGWLSSSTAGGSRISSPGSTSKLSSAGSSDRISSRTGGRISSSSGSGRTNSTGGRVISSSDRPIRSTGSGAGGNKERISVCKMAALSISAAGRERSQDRRRQAQWSQQQQQQAAATSPLVQRWLTTGVGVTSADPDGLDDIMRL